MTPPTFYTITPEASANLRALGIYIEPGRALLHSDTFYEPPIALPSGHFSTAPFQIGAFSYSLNHVNAQVHKIGRYCSIAGASHFGAAEHPTKWLSTSSFTYDPNYPLFADFAVKNLGFQAKAVPMEKRHQGIVIEHDVWIGSLCYIRGGVTLGTGCIVGTGSVVTKDVPPYSIVAGNPATIKRYRFKEQTIERLLASQWWNYKFTDFEGIDFTNVEHALDSLAASQLIDYRPEKIRITDYLMADT